MRIGWGPVFVLLLAPALHALDVTVGSSFIISGITRPEGKVILPLEREGYYNVRILDKATYDFVSSCTQSCRQELGEMTPTVVQVRPAQTRENMWIAHVNFNQAWRVTFLVFKEKNGYRVKPAQHFRWISHSLQQQTRQMILQAVEREIV